MSDCLENLHIIHVGFVLKSTQHRFYIRISRHFRINRCAISYTRTVGSLSWREKSTTDIPHKSKTIVLHEVYKLLKSINCKSSTFFFSINSHLIFLHFSPKFLYFFPSSNISFWQKFPRHEIGSFSGIPVLTLWSPTIYYILFVHIKCT